MANDEHLAILRSGVDTWNRWRDSHPAVEPGLRGADLRNSDLKEVDFRGASLDRADLSTANLRSAKLNRASLKEAQLKRTKLDSACCVGIDLSRAVLVEADLFEADLSGANFRSADLREASLVRANLSGANLEAASLIQSDLRAAKVRGANLSDADLTGASARSADFSGSVLRRTDLRWANLSGSSFCGVDLSGSMMGGTWLGRVNLADVKGLDSVLHEEPSTIGIDTIYLSKGKIPEVFLRGAGVPENLIVYMRSLVGSAIEYYSCFISYSSKDEEFAQRLHADLQAKGVRCWFAPHDVQGGKKLHAQIDQAIRVHERVLLILSAHSMTSEWVKTEIAKARKREGEQKKQVLFPLRLVSFETIRDWECFDPDAGKDSAREIREYFIPDFSDWMNHEAYRKAFGRLMLDLKAEEKGPG